jgi:hypothetical protein
MVEIWSVVMLIVGLVTMFIGAYFALAASSMRKPIEQLVHRVEGHENRLGHLERRDASRQVEIESINAGIARIESMLQKHMDRS